MSLLTVDPMGRTRPARVAIGSVGFDPLTAVEAVTYIRDALAKGSGGRLAVVDADVHRRAVEQPGLRAGLAESTLVLAESIAAVWSSRIAGHRLPQRVSGPALADALSAACAADGWRVFVIGGVAGGAGEPSGAQRAAAVLGLRCPGLRVVGCASPPEGYHADPSGWSAVVADVLSAKPDLVLLSAGPVVQERIREALWDNLPGTWLFGCAGIVEAIHSERPWRGVGRALAGAVYGARLLARTAAVRAGGWLRSRIRSDSAPSNQTP